MSIRLLPHVALSLLAAGLLAVTPGCSTTEEPEVGSSEDAIAIAKSWAERLGGRFTKVGAAGEALREAGEDAGLGRDDPSVERALSGGYGTALAELDASLEQLESVINNEVEFGRSVAKLPRDVSKAELVAVRDAAQELRGFLAGDYNKLMGALGIGTSPERRVARDAFRRGTTRLVDDAKALEESVLAWLGTGTGGGTGAAERIALFASADCSDSALASVELATDCRTLPQGRAKAFTVGGRCRSIPSAKLSDACLLYKNALSPEAVALSSDSSATNVIAFSAPNAKCDWADVETANTTVSSVRVGDQTTSLPGLSLVNACKLYGAAGSKYAVGITSDDGGASVVAFTSPDATCDWDPALGIRAWGIRINGSGRNTPDWSPADACKLFRSAAVPDAVGITDDDGGNNVVAYTSPLGKCDWETTAYAAGKAWGYNVKGTGTNSDDMPPPSACKLFRAAGASDRVGLLSSGRVVGFTSAVAPCDWEGATSVSVDGIQLAGTSRSVNSAPAMKACKLFSAAAAPGGALVFASGGCSGVAAAAVGPKSDCRMLAEAFTGDALSKLPAGGACQTLSPIPFAQLCRDTVAP